MIDKSHVSTLYRQAPRPELEPISIVIQAEDGQDLTEASLDEESILFYLREVIHTFEVGEYVMSWFVISLALSQTTNLDASKLKECRRQF